MNGSYEVRPARARPGWRAWALPAYNVAVTAGVVALGLVLLVTGSLGQRLGGVALVVVGGWWARSVAVSLRRLRRRPTTPAPVRVRLDEVGVTVFNGAGDDTGGDGDRPATLHWADCIAVVASPTPVRAGNGRPLSYVHFMPRAEELVRCSDVPPAVVQVKSRLCGIPLAPSAALAWVLAGSDADRVPEVLAQVRARAPHVRIVDSTRHGRGADAGGGG